jgi:hypothetical protein
VFSQMTEYDQSCQVSKRCAPDPWRGPDHVQGETSRLSVAISATCHVTCTAP